MARASWGSRLGFIIAAAGSAIGLANIWRFPYIVGHYGGAAFILIYLLFLIMIGIPVFIAEVLIGRTAQASPSGAFEKLGRSKLWGGAGKMTIATGFIVSCFYSVVAGWMLGYLFLSIGGSVASLQSTALAAEYFTGLVSHPWWSLANHALFMLMSTAILYFGVRHGIEKSNKILLPMLFIVMTILLIRGLTLPGAEEALEFLLRPNWSAITPAAAITALGHAFFTLSLGQGTMVTYGSYIKGKDNLVTTCIPAVIMDTVVSLMAAAVVFTIVFGAGHEPNAGPGLVFHTLPTVFTHLGGGQFLAILFFLLVVLAAITSQISAMEPTIAYLIENWNFKRHPATLLCGSAAFIVGIPCALAAGLLQDVQIFGMDILDAVSSFASDILIPLGGFFAVVLVGWRWGTASSLKELLPEGTPVWIRGYFWFCFKIAAPFLMVIVFLDALGLFR
ncbi:MAG: sodium-dependent transporter [Parachlamydiales bacterium]|jgi:NSS family neurotransmitter:Na+ symporter